MNTLPEVDLLLDKLASQIQSYLASKGIDQYVMIGIRSGGVWVAQALQKRVGYTGEIGELDISFYRDDFTRSGLNPAVSPTNLPFSCDNTHILLVDDILMSGRTIRAAMNELFDFGRPSSILLAVLLDIGKRELPIAPTFVGDIISLAPSERIKIEGPDKLRLIVKDETN